MKQEFIKYFISSGIAFVIDFFMLYILTEFGHIYYVISATLSFIAGLITVYILSTKWVFKGRKLTSRYKEFIIFSIIGVIGVIINSSGIWFATEKLRLHYLESKIAVTFIVFIWNFSARKFILF